MRIERYYHYDGVRRIQQIAGQETIQGDFSIAVSETGWHTDREYLYGPDYVDEFVAQVFDPATAPRLTYMLQDANYNVVALVDTPAGESAEVLAQYAYEPYGDRVYAEEDLNADTVRDLPGDQTVGHQGLFHYTFNTGTWSLTPGTPGLYYNRNRWYSPRLGRFLQRDPNESGLLVLRALAMNGMVAEDFAGMFDPKRHYQSGLSLYQYTFSNPWKYGDPLGLMPEWLASAILWATGGQQSWLDDPKTVEKVSDYLAWGGTAILMFTPAGTVESAIQQVASVLRLTEIPGAAALGHAAWAVTTRFTRLHTTTKTVGRVGMGVGFALGVFDAATGQRTSFLPLGATTAGTSFAAIVTSLWSSAGGATMAVPFSGAGGMFFGYNAGTAANGMKLRHKLLQIDGLGHR